MEEKMRRGNIFWGLVIVLAGVVLLLNTLGFIVVNNIWALFWPLVLVVLGLWFLIGPFLDRGSLETRDLTIPLGSAQRARLKIRHGAGRLDIGSSSTPGTLLTGQFAGGVDDDTRMDGDEITARLRGQSSWSFGFPPSGFQGYNWKMDLTRDVPLRLNLHTGASEAYLDWRDLKVVEFSVDAGASKVEITLPSAAGLTRGKIDTGAASVTIHFPEGVAGRIVLNHGLSEINIDQQRFIQNGSVYSSTAFESSANRVELSIDAGVGSIKID
jgi:hypothetical protein